MKIIVLKKLFAQRFTKIWQPMKLTIVFLTFALVQVSANGLSQKVTISKQNVNLVKIFEAFEAQTPYVFVYRNQDIAKGKPLNVDFKEVMLDDALKIVLQNQPLTYEIINKTIVLSLKSKESIKATSDVNLNQAPIPPSIIGVVMDENSKEFANVTVKNQRTKKGISTDNKGKFSIDAEVGDVIEFSYIGYEVLTIKVTSDQQNMKVSMKVETQQLNTLVVTALGIKRDKKSLGYSVQELNGENLSTAKEVNIANSLAGKISGVQVSRSSGGVGGASKVIIRGSNSLVGNSLPLYVVDGIPIDNSLPSHPAFTALPAGTDYGDGISNINPEDIESVSVLKGPNASALYGQRGSNGVILITTKSGKSHKGIGVKYGVDYSVGDALVLPDFQNEYGQGLDGNFTNFLGNDGKSYTMAAAIAGNIQGVARTSAGRDRFTRGSWGAKMTGQAYVDQWGNKLNFSPQPDTYQQYFNQENHVVNNLSIDGGNETVNFRVSFANTKVNGYVPTNTLNRNNITLRTMAKITSKLDLDISANYIKQNVENRPTLGDASDNPTYLLISQPRSLPMSVLAQSSWTAADVANQLGYGAVPYVGLEKGYATNSSTANPYWTRDHTHNNDERNRLIGIVKLSYQFNSWIRLTAKTGLDTYTDNRFRYREKNTYSSQNKNGDIREEVSRVKENNSDVLLSLNPKVSQDFSVSMNLGSNHQTFYNRTIGNSGLEFIAPSLYAINNTLINTYVFSLNESVANSVYGAAVLGYKDYFFLDVAARNDWSSTLSKENNSFFYPSFSGSVIASEWLHLKSDFLSYLKFRGSWAQAGSSGSPYQLTGNYYLDQYTHGGLPLGYYTGSIPDPNLKNELTTSNEVGVEARFIKNRVGFSFVMYNASTKNQILDVPLPASTTFSSRRINAGEIQNNGMELSISGTPIKTQKGFSWDVAVNMSRNRNKVVSLADGVSSFLLGQDRSVNVIATPGKSFGTLLGTSFKWLRDDKGNRLIDPTTGLPLKTASKTTYEMGSALPDWVGGINNTFRYKGISVSALIETSQGGKIFSESLREELVFGNTTKTLAGRDGTYIAQGVVAAKNTDGTWSGTGVVNAKQVKAQDYWNIVAPDKDNAVSEELLNDASYVMLREVVLSYQIPSSIMKKLPFRNARLGIYGRNLFYFQRFTDGYAPDASAVGINNSSLGIESTSLPLMRYFGVSLNVEF